MNHREKIEKMQKEMEKANENHYYEMLKIFNKKFPNMEQVDTCEQGGRGAQQLITYALKDEEGSSTKYIRADFYKICGCEAGCRASTLEKHVYFEQDSSSPPYKGRQTLFKETFRVLHHSQGSTGSLEVHPEIEKILGLG